MNSISDSRHDSSSAASTAAKPRVLITHWVHPEVMAYLERTCVVIANSSLETWPHDRVLELASGCDAVMAFMPDWVDERFLAACPHLRIVAGALKGADNFDVDACTRRGVWLARVPDLLSAPTAELAFGLMIALARNLLPGDEHIRSGQFRGWRPKLYGTGLAGRTLGLIGLGAVGSAIAQRAAAFGMSVIHSDPHQAPATLVRLPLNELLERSDYVLPLAPLTGETLHLIDATAISHMKPGAYLVNVGRGSLVDESAVASALAAGHLGGYAADVFAMEDWALASRPRSIPPSLLERRDKTFFTPHLGSAVEEARLAIAMKAAENILDAFAGRRPRGAVNNPVRGPSERNGDRAETMR